ncbi:MAG: hypothetical protein LAT63_00165 [Marinobacter sp.]|nr:hypothetical protein [Marinobacter sp.]
MRALRQLIQVMVFSAVSLLVVAIAIALLFLALELASPSELWRPFGAFRVGFYATLVVGAAPAILVGAPAYWWVWRLGYARWLIVLPVGAVLGTLAALLDLALIGWGVGCGAAPWLQGLPI